MITTSEQEAIDWVENWPGTTEPQVLAAGIKRREKRIAVLEKQRYNLLVLLHAIDNHSRPQGNDIGSPVIQGLIKRAFKKF